MLHHKTEGKSYVSIEEVGGFGGSLLLVSCCSVWPCGAVTRRRVRSLHTRHHTIPLLSLPVAHGLLFLKPAAYRYGIWEGLDFSQSSKKSDHMPYILWEKNTECPNAATLLTYEKCWNFLIAKIDEDVTLWWCLLLRIPRLKSALTSHFPRMGLFRLDKERHNRAKTRSAQWIILTVRSSIMVPTIKAAPLGEEGPAQWQFLAVSVNKQVFQEVGTTLSM